MQARERALGPALEAAMLAALQEEPNGVPWQAMASGTAGVLADAVRAAGHAGTSATLALDMSLPAATQARQHALALHLRRALPGACSGAGTEAKSGAGGCGDAPWAPSGFVTDLKAAVRLALGGPLAAALGVKLASDAPVRMGLAFVHMPSAGEADFLYSEGGGARRKRKRGTDTAQPGRSASDDVAARLRTCPENKFGEQACVPPRASAVCVSLAARVRREPVYVAGRYLKLQRDVSNSPFFIGGQRLGRTSVQEELERHLVPLLRADRAKFMCAGREDLDVRMLGDGRPFVLELHNARNPHPDQGALDATAAALAAADVGVSARGLRLVGREALVRLKAGESEKQKSYEVTVRMPAPVTPEMLASLSAMREVLLQQTTPERVAHRRALLVRPRMVHEMCAAPLEGDPCGLVLRLRTQAGTYIKEFVHGDGGRTTPDLASLAGCDGAARVLALDVVQVHMDFL
ncbi:hypothetical protein WJX81_006632 [Elliptochloris bilobata]|uniref:tRNA pseudouridine(55) synthase n=1 Tax=Elliptochloris bilobata TaxID=381761 RepID=A0AAW1RAK2_9CHLO